MSRLIKIHYLLLILGFVSVPAVLAQTDDPMAVLRQSHIDANVPDKKDFDLILKRDLTRYVTDKNDKNIAVTIELLRDVPSQSGVALPKYYCWIEKRNAKGELMEEAAARIAAVNRDHFEVVQYYDRKRLENEQELVSKVFPADVYEKILKKLKP
jgi:hypothetical protein